MPLADGSCTFPKTPMRSAATAPAANAVSGMAMPFWVVVSAMGSECPGSRSFGNGPAAS